MSPTISVSCAGRRSLQGSGMNIESDKHVQVTLPDHQVTRGTAQPAKISQ